MKSGLSTVQQTLTPEASEVLAASISEAAKRNHSQTTPLHVAASLLASPSGFLRKACVRSHPNLSHPNSSHPLQSRALDLCFSVALERLPATLTGNVETGGAESAPPVSNALMAALKRAQAHQRRGCPEQQQQPLLAVKVELEQLVISILDDPSVSRVMREARFSSPAVKAAIEQSLLSHPPPLASFRPSVAPSMNTYLNPCLQQGNCVEPGVSGTDEIKRVSEIFSRPNKRNPILVGEHEPKSVMDDILKRLGKGELLKDTVLIQLNKDFVSDKLRDLGKLIEAKVGNGGVVVDLGDLKWVVEAGRGAVDDVANIVARVGDGRLWLIGTATCETYLRCKIYYPSMENDWDLQAVPIASRSPFPGMVSSPMKTFQNPNVLPRRVPESLDPTKPSSRCPQCTENCEQELAKLVVNQYQKSSLEVGSEPARPPLPQWLQNAKSDDSKSLDQSKTKDQEMVFKKKTQELQKNWSDTCLRLHPNFHNNLGSQRVKPPMTLYNPKLLLHQPLQQKPQPNKELGVSLQLNLCPKINQITENIKSPPRSPVRTDLVLGRPKITEPSLENSENERVMDLLGCVSSYQVEKFAKALDTDSYKRILKALMEKVWWQKEAASKVASAVTKSKTGDGKRNGTLSKGDTWILFTGPDRIGKKKVATIISDHICGSDPIMIGLGRRRSNEEIAMSLRGKTVLDRIVEAVKRNPFSVIMLEDIDEADMVIRGSIKRAMETGRLSDSYGREFSLGNVLFILTANWLPDNFRKMDSDQMLDENKIRNLSSGGWQLRLRVSQKSAKRRPHWLHDNDRLFKSRRDLVSGLSLDLNLMADFNDSPTEGSPNSSGVTVDHDDDQIQRFSITSVPIEFANFINDVNFIDDVIIFKPLEISSVQNEIRKKISEKFLNVIKDVSLEVDENALEKILGGVWLGRTGLEEWGENVLLPSFRKIKMCLPSNENIIVRLEIDSDSGTRSNGDWLPSSIKV